MPRNFLFMGMGGLVAQVLTTMVLLQAGYPPASVASLGIEGLMWFAASGCALFIISQTNRNRRLIWIIGWAIVVGFVLITLIILAKTNAGYYDDGPATDTLRSYAGTLGLFWFVIAPSPRPFRWIRLVAGVTFVLLSHLAGLHAWLFVTFIVWLMGRMAQTRGQQQYCLVLAGVMAVFPVVLPQLDVLGLAIDPLRQVERCLIPSRLAVLHVLAIPGVDPFSLSSYIPEDEARCFMIGFLAEQGGVGGLLMAAGIAAMWMYGVLCTWSCAPNRYLQNSIFKIGLAFLACVWVHTLIDMGYLPLRCLPLPLFPGDLFLFMSVVSLRSALSTQGVSGPGSC